MVKFVRFEPDVDDPGGQIYGISISVSTQGLPRGSVDVSYWSACGNIKNGVGFNFGQGGWVISHWDFYKMALIIPFLRFVSIFWRIEDYLKRAVRN